MTDRAVFLSYASEDTAAAQRLCETLRAAGIEVWFDRSELRGGDAWDRQIRRQIHDCALFVAIISGNSDARSEGYFRREWRMAVERTHDMAEDTPFLLPVVIDGTPESAARVPDAFRDVHWTHLPEGHAPADFVGRVQRLLSPMAAPAPSSSGDMRRARPVAAGASAPAATPVRRWRQSAALFAVAGALVLGYVALTRWVWPPHAPAAPTSKDATVQKSIAVLPFADMSEQHDQEYFADGMAEEILDLLAKLPELRVIGRTSSFQFKARNEDLRTIGEKLGAAYLVEGTVRKAGNRVRVTAQLIDAASGTQVWADSYDRDFGDVLNLQDQVAAGITRALQLAVVAEDARPKRPLQNPEAYTHYLRGRAGLDAGDSASVQSAVGELEQALTLDPQFTRAAEALALVHLSLLSNGDVPSRVGWPTVAAAARRALHLDPRSPLSHAILGLQYATFAYDWAAAAGELRQAMAVNTRDPVALYNISWLAFDLGQHDLAVRMQNQSVAIDPLNPDAYQNGAIIDYLMGHLDAAESGLRASIRISPTFAGNHWFLGQVYLQRGDLAAALREMQAETTGSRDFGLTLVYHALGRHADSDAALARATRSGGANNPLNIAMLYAYRGERDQAFAWLNKAVDERDPALGHKILDEPKLAPLRSDPRFKAVLTRMNLPRQ